MSSYSLTNRKYDLKAILGFKYLSAILFAIYSIFILVGVLSERLYILAIPILILAVIILSFQVKLIYWLLLSTIPLSITIDFSKSLSTDFPTEFLSIALTGVFWILYLRYKPKEMFHLWNSKIFWVIFAVLIWSMISSILAVNKIIAFKYCAAKIWYLTAYLIASFWIIKSKQDIKKIFWLIFIPTLITAFYCFYNTWVGDFNFENTNKFSLPFYDNHVIYATIMSLLIPVTFVARSWYPSGSILRMFLNISIAFLLIAIYFSYTRACYLALIVSFIIYILIRWKKVVLVYSFSVIFVISVLFYFSKDYFYLRLAPDFNTTVMHNDFKDHLISTFYGKDVSSMERLNMWVSVFRMHLDRPIIGFGPNNFPSSYKPYGVLYFKTWVSDNPLNLSCHNYFWLLLAEQGLVGCILFVFLLGYILYLAQKLYHTSEDDFIRSMAISIGATIGIFIIILFFNDLIETSKNGSLFFIFIAILIKLKVWSQEKLSPQDGISSIH